MKLIDVYLLAMMACLFIVSAGIYKKHHASTTDTISIANTTYKTDKVDIANNIQQVTTTINSITQFLRAIVSLICFILILGLIGCIVVIFYNIGTNNSSDSSWNYWKSNRYSSKSDPIDSMKKFCTNLMDDIESYIKKNT